MAILSPVLMLFGLIFAGWFSCRVHLLDEGGIAGLTALTLYIAIPCLTVAKMQQPYAPEIVRGMFFAFSLGLLIILLSGLIGWLLFFRKDPQRRRVLTHLMLFSNCGFMGYPVIEAVLGEEAMIYAVMFNAAFNLLMWSLGVALYAGKKGFALKKLLTMPALIAVWIGFILFLCKIRLPSVLQQTLETLGSLTTTLSMLVIGARMRGISPRSFADRLCIAVSALRLLALPLLAYALCIPLGIPALVRNVLVLSTAMPCAAATAMQAERFGGDAQFASRCIALSTGLSLFTIPLIVLLFS